MMKRALVIVSLVVFGILAGNANAFPDPEVKLDTTGKTNEDTKVFVQCLVLEGKLHASGFLVELVVEIST